MLSLSSSTRYFLYHQPADMRCGIYSLAGLVENSLKLNPVSGDVFIFIGKSGNQIRLLQWDRDGYALYIKRLEAGTFERPADTKLQLSPQELMLILQGIKLKSVQLRKRYSIPPES
jgi:transposase